MTKDYKEKFVDAQEYQDFIACYHQHEMGLCVGVFGSKKYQLIGESAAGVEIKFDGNFRKTGNLYIEIAEKSDPSNPNYTASGILRDDNTWLWVIGDWDEARMIAKNSLVLIYRCPEEYKAKRNIRTTQSDTSIGMLLPIPFVDRNILVKKIEFEDAYKWQART